MNGFQTKLIYMYHWNARKRWNKWEYSRYYGDAEVDNLIVHDNEI
jgi:hypothetical protein